MFCSSEIRSNPRYRSSYSIEMIHYSSLLQFYANLYCQSCCSSEFRSNLWYRSSYSIEMTHYPSLLQFYANFMQILCKFLRKKKSHVLLPRRGKISRTCRIKNDATSVLTFLLATAEPAGHFGVAAGHGRRPGHGIGRCGGGVAGGVAGGVVSVGVVAVAEAVDVGPLRRSRRFAADDEDRRGRCAARSLLWRSLLFVGVGDFELVAVVARFPGRQHRVRAGDFPARTAQGRARLARCR